MAWSISKAVLVPYDFSAHSRVAVEKALSIADSPSQVHILHVLPTFIPLAPEGFPVEAIDDQVRLESTQKALDEEFADPRFAQCSKEVMIGDPGLTCVERAKTIGADLIVIPSHGRSGISRLVLGSVAERVVRFSHVPVLVIKISDS
jgi:nucleotide-binding universal stress UspA family protein